MKKLLVGLGLALAAGGVWAGGMESLEAFVKNVKSGRAEFTQTVTAPPRDGQSVSPYAAQTSMPLSWARRIRSAMSLSSYIKRPASLGVER